MASFVVCAGAGAVARSASPMGVIACVRTDRVCSAVLTAIVGWEPARLFARSERTRLAEAMRARERPGGGEVLSIAAGVASWTETYADIPRVLCRRASGLW